MSSLRPSNGYYLRYSLAFALRGVKVRGRRLELTEEDRYEAADRVIQNMDRLGNFQWLHEPAPEPAVGATGPSTYKPD